MGSKQRVTPSDGLVAVGLILTAAAVGLLAGWAWALLVVGVALLVVGLLGAMAEGSRE